MSGGEKWDLARQAANLVGALFQVGVTAVASAAISDVVDSGPTPLVEPALYAFFAWGPIFALSLVYAAYQALPPTAKTRCCGAWGGSPRWHSCAPACGRSSSRRGSSSWRS